MSQFLPQQEKQSQLRSSLHIRVRGYILWYNSTFRTFGRFDSGKLNSTGTKFYAAFARTDNNKWKGYGNQDELQANFKLVQPVKDIGKISAIFDWSDFTQYNYMTEDLNMIKKMGTSIDFLYPNYGQSSLAAQGIYPAGYQVLGNSSDEQNATYDDAAQVQRNYLSAITAEFKLAHNLIEKTILYSHESSGDYEASQDFAAPNGAPMSQMVGHTMIRRIGGVQSFNYEINKNHIDTGFWYENNSFSFPDRLYAEPLSTTGKPLSPISGFVNPYTTEFDDEYNTNTFQFFLQDKYYVLPNLSLMAGFKSLLQTTHGGGKINNAAYTGVSSIPRGDLTAANAFLPHFALNYNFLKHNEFYIDISENMRAYTYAPWNVSSGGAWAVQGQAQFDANKQSLRPERVWDYVVGYRYSSPIITATADFYHTDYYNRLVNTDSGSIFQPVNTFSNAGHETINGVDTGLTIRPFHGLEFFNSFSYSDAVYNGGINYEGSYVSLVGKHQVGYPKFMYKTSLTYSYRNASGGIEEPLIDVLGR
ncbi:hypothetical protein CFR75_17140 [Komagataeibacter xylinus]|uniref:TonB-dependent receptor-like beta-barrel domain-containing protein n=1 Tax=Komagataeibacter xylinus TaxID=28448 RepID=A0A318PDV2_KOMXY|nr:hypothetical protein CFR75_17140 [Komagataeibacter xylinus]